MHLDTVGIPADLLAVLIRFPSHRTRTAHPTRFCLRDLRLASELAHQAPLRLIRTAHTLAIDSEYIVLLFVSYTRELGWNQYTQGYCLVEGKVLTWGCAFIFKLFSRTEKIKIRESLQAHVTSSLLIRYVSIRENDLSHLKRERYKELEVIGEVVVLRSKFEKDCQLARRGFRARGCASSRLWLFCKT